VSLFLSSVNAETIAWRVSWADCRRYCRLNSGIKMNMPIDTEGQHLSAIMTIDDCPPKTASWKYALTCVLVILGSLFAYDFKISAAPSRHHPNVLFIAVDDLRPELQCYASQVMKPRAITPHLDRLAASGILFSHAYCNQAVCGASRLSLMTGLYPEFTGERTYHVTDWRTRWPHVVTINQHFRANGYTTVGLEKYIMAPLAQVSIQPIGPSGFR